MIDTLDKIHMMLNSIATTAALSNTSGYTDFSKMLETFTKDLFSVLDNTSFDPPKNTKSNNETIEYTAKNGTEYQITTNINFKSKCETTIDGFLKTRKKGHKLKIIFYRPLNKSELSEKRKLLNVNKKYVDILDLNDIGRLIADCSNENVNKIYKFCYDVKPIDFDNLPIDTFTQNCKLCDDFIERSFTLQTSDNNYQIENCEKLLEFSENLLIVGDASLGKTEILKYINNYAITQNRFVYRFELKHYSGKSIKDIIPNGFTLFSEPLLILDGFDEIENQFVDNFIKELNIYSQCNPTCQIILSSRANFCDKNKSTFSNFLYFTINELTDIEIQDYFCFKIGKENYLKKLDLCKTLNVFPLLKNPFYLTRIAKSVMENDSISNKSDLMHSILVNDYNNYKFKDKISFGEILKVLKDFALYLLKNEKSVCELDEYTLLDSVEMRSFSWLSFDENKLSFVHNNFKEYLIALHFKDCSFSKLKKLISVRIDKIFIKPQFCNILSFLLTMTNNSKLSKYMLKYGKNIVLDIETTSLSDDDKYFIINEIYKEYEQKKSWPDAYLYNTNKLAQICNTKKIIEFLISYVTPQTHRTILIFTLEILRDVLCFFGYKDDLKYTIMSWLKNDDNLNDDNIISSLLYFLNKLDVSQDEIRFLYKKFRKYPKSRVRGAVNFLIKEKKLTAEFLNELIEGLEFGRLKAYTVGEKRDDIIDFSENYNIEKAISELTQESPIIYLLDYIIENERKYESKSIIEHVFTAIKNLPLVNVEIQNKIFQLLKLTSTHFAHHLRPLISELVINLNLSKLIVDKILHDSDLKYYKKNLLTAIIFTNDCTESCVEYFKSQDINITNEFITILKSNNTEWENVKKDFHTCGIKCREMQNLYEIERKRNNQKNFEILFDVAKIKKLINNVFKVVGEPKLTRKAIRSFYLKEQENIPMYLYSLFENDSKTPVSKKDIYNRVNINWQVRHIYEILHSNKEISISSNNIAFIDNWVKEQLLKFNFETAISYEDGSWRTSYNAIYCEFFIRTLNLSVDKDIYKQMLCFSWGSTSDQDFTQLCYLEEKLGTEDFKKYLSEYCNTLKIKGYLLNNRIRYCIDKNYNILSDCIIKNLKLIVSDTTEHYDNTILLDYLKNFNMLDEALNYYKDFPVHLKIYLIQLCAESKNTQIINYALEDIKRGDESAIKIAKELLLFAEPVALRYYIKWASSNAELYNVNDYPYPSLKAYTNIKHLKLLLKCLDLTYKLEDDENKIRSDIMYCLEKICIASKVSVVRRIVTKLNRYIKKSKHENINYLHYYLDGIKFNYIKQ